MFAHVNLYDYLYGYADRWGKLLIAMLAKIYILVKLSLETVGYSTKAYK